MYLSIITKKKTMLECLDNIKHLTLKMFVIIKITGWSTCVRPFGGVIRIRPSRVLITSFPNSMHCLFAF